MQHTDRVGNGRCNSRPARALHISNEPIDPEHCKNIQSRIWAIRGIPPSIRLSATAGVGAFASDAAYATAWGLPGWSMRQASMDGLAR